MAAKRVDTLAAQPTTERGRGLLIGGHQRTRTITYCNGKCVILRSIDDPRQCSVYTDHSYACTVARISPNGEWVASGDITGIVRVWARNPPFALKYESKALTGPVDDIAWSEDGQRIVVSGDGKQVFVRAFMWDSGGGMGDFDGHSDRVLSCDFRPKRPFRIFSCGEDFLVNYYEGPPFRFKHSIRDHSNFVNCVRFSPDGARAISVSSDKKGLILDAQTGQVLGSLGAQGGHTGSIYAVAWSSDNKHVVTVSADKTAKIWKIADDGSTGEVVSSYAFSSSGVERKGTSTGSIDDMQVGCLWLGDTIVTVSLDGTFNVIPASPADITSGGPPAVKHIEGHSKYVTALASAEGDTEVYSAGYDGKVVRWAEATGTGTALLGKCHASVAAIAVVDGTLVTVGLDDTMRLTPLPATGFSSSSPIPLGAQPKSLSVALGNTSGEGPLMLLATVKGLSLFQGSKLLGSQALPFEPATAAISPDGKQAAVGSSADGTIWLYSVNVSAGGVAFTESRSLERHRGPITTLAYSPNGAYLASGDQNREAVVWDIATGEVKLKNLVYHTARISCLAWSPDSSQVATGALDLSIIVYGIGRSTDDRVTIKNAHVGGLSALLFQGNTKIVSAGLDSCLRVWELI